MNIKVFVVFHKIIDEIIFSHFSNNEIDKFFIKYGVNNNYTKIVIYRKLFRRLFKKNNDNNVLLEYSLKKYDSNLQTQGYMEGSCYAHINDNNLYDNLDYIGICQYDMRWTNKASTILRNISNSHIDTKNVWGVSVGSIMSIDKQFHEFAFPNAMDWNFVLKSYNEFFNTDWPIDFLINKPFTLYQTYLLPKTEFIQLSNWLKVLMRQLYPWANQDPYPTHWGHLAGWIERAEALYIAARIHENRLIFNHLPIDHDENISKNLGLVKRHYSEYK